MDKRQNVNGRRFFFGFILLFIGLVMILERSGILSWEIYDFILSWKMLLIAIGGFVFFSGNRGAGIVVMGIGAFFMIPDIFEDYDQIKRFFWPALLLLVGISFMFGPRRKKFMKDKNFEGRATHFKEGSTYYKEGSSKFSDGTTQVSNDYFDEFVIFGGREINMSSQNLLGGRSTAIFGGAEVDLRQCEISSQGCTVELTTLFGGNVLKVPNDWTVLNKVTTLFGGYSDLRIKDPSYMPNPAKTILITGVCLFGGTEVRNYSKAH